MHFVLFFPCTCRCSDETWRKTAALSCYSGPSAAFGDYCPTPPGLNIDDYSNSSIRGPLDSDNTYVAEYLLGVSDDLQPSVFFQEVQAGFVVSYQEPALTLCGCSDSESRQATGLLDILYNISAFNFTAECNETLTACRDELYQGPYDFSSCEDALMNGCVPDDLNITLPGGYYENLPYDMQLALLNLKFPCSRQSVAKTYPVQEDTLTVTIWYNNQVSYMYVYTHRTLISSNLKRPAY